MRLKGFLGTVFCLALVAIVGGCIFLARWDCHSLAPKIVLAVKASTGRELKLGGPISIMPGLSPTLAAENVALQNAPWGSRPESAKVKRIEVRIALLPLILKEVKIRRLILIEPDILIETDPSGRSNFALGQPADSGFERMGGSERGKGTPSILVDQVRIEKGRITYIDGKSGARSVLEVNRFSAASREGETQVEAVLEGRFNGLPLEAKGSVFNPWSLFQGLPSSFDLKAEIAGAALALEGRLGGLGRGQGTACSFSARGADASGLEKLFRRPVPLRGPFEISGRIEHPAGSAYRVSQFRASLAGSLVRGSGEVDLSGRRPKIAAELSSKKIDLRNGLPQEADGGGPGGSSGPPEGGEARVFSKNPLPCTVLEQFDAEIRFKAGQVLLPRLAFREVELNLLLKEGNLKADPVRIGVGGGALKGRLELQARGGEAAASTAFKIERFDLGRMLKDLEVNEGLEGKIDADAALSGRGGSAAELMASLNGRIVLAMGKGKIANRHIETLGADLSSSVFRMLNPFDEASSYTGFNCLVCRFDVKDGLAESAALVFDSDRMSVLGEGKIDLRTEKMDLSLRPVPKNGIGIKGLGKISLSIGQLAKPFKLGGTLAKPSLAVDPARTAIALGKAVGGVVLFGPVGIAAALADCDPNQENPCLSALQALKADAAESKDQRGEGQKGAFGRIRGVFEGAGRTLKEILDQ